MKHITITATSIDEAREKAAQELNIPPESISITKLDETDEDALEGAAPLESRFRAEPKTGMMEKEAQQILKGLLEMRIITVEKTGDI